MDINLFPDGPGAEYSSTEDTTSYLNSLDEETKRQEQKVEQTVQAQEPQQEASQSPEQSSDRVAGSGAERNPIDAAVAFGADIIDNVFGGDSKTYDEIRDKISNKREESGGGTYLDRAANDNDVVKAALEPKRAFDGALLGAAEKVAGAVEVAGDTVKATTAEVVKRATLGNVVLGADEDGSQNPFSDNYDWATWNLGKDEVGAQTGVGKVAQGFGEFAVLMAGTGGFAGGGSTLAGTAVRGGLAGIKADMLSAVSGEGNMSNMIGDAVPELKDTWLTALAIQKDDNVFEAAMKTGLEGFGIGVPVELAVGGFARGVRALASGKNADKAVEVAKEAIPPVQTNQRLEEIGSMIMASDDVERFGRFEQIMDLNAKGIPTTWDDAAATVPEYYVKGAREVADDFSITSYERIQDLQPGQKTPSIRSRVKSLSVEPWSTLMAKD